VDSKDHRSTAPKPFVFVLIPFADKFKDRYLFGIKGAAEDAGAYAERLDEQMFTEGMLERIFNQISKADVIVADMSQRNPNVFYEVGYAHALDKIVLLITEDAEDIPFDLKHRQHIVYDDIGTLRQDLTAKIAWAIAEAKLRLPAKPTPIFDLNLFGHSLPNALDGRDAATIPVGSSERTFNLPLLITNVASETSPPIDYMYLVADSRSRVYPIEWIQQSMNWTTNLIFPAISVQSTKSDEISTGMFYEPRKARGIAIPQMPGSTLDTSYRLDLKVPALPPEAMEERYLALGALDAPADEIASVQERFRLKLHSGNTVLEYPFDLQLTVALINKDKPAEKSAKQLRTKNG
jgi:hypothetical protein